MFPLYGLPLLLAPLLRPRELISFERISVDGLNLGALLEAKLLEGNLAVVELWPPPRRYRGALPLLLRLSVRAEAFGAT